MVPLLKLVEHRASQQDCADCAADDIAEQMRYKGRLASARRLKRSQWGAEPAKLETLDVYFWRAHGVRYFGGEVLVIPLWEEPELGREVSDYVFYASLPDYEKIFGPMDANQSAAAPVQEMPETRGRKAAYSYPQIGNDLVRWLAQNDAVAGNKSVRNVAYQFELWCEKRGRIVPTSSQLRAYVTGVLNVLRAPPRDPSK
jgi:hypothetical protein